MVEIEDESNIVEREIGRCSWCGELDREKKVYASPGDDIENPKAYHEKCFKALQMFMMLAWSNDENKSTEELVAMANAFTGIENKKKKKK